MNVEEQIRSIIEKLREELNQLIEAEESQELIYSKSVELDKHLMEYQRNYMN